MKAVEERELADFLEWSDAQRACKAKRRLMGQRPLRRDAKQAVYLTPAAIRFVKELALELHCSTGEALERLFEKYCRLKLLDARRRRKHEHG